MLAYASQKIDECYNQQLRGLELDHLQLDSLPTSISKLADLRRLDLSNNNFATLPSEIQTLTRLQSLRLCVNGVVPLVVPGELISCLANLTVLKLARNALVQVPHQVTQLKQLSILDVGGNRLRALPNDMTGLTRLTLLQADNNDLQSLPQLSAKHLSGLLLSHNALLVPSLGSDWFEHSIQYLKRLTHLELRACGISEWPMGIVALSGLKMLDLGCNRIASIPSASLSPSSSPVFAPSSTSTNTHTTTPPRSVQPSSSASASASGIDSTSVQQQQQQQQLASDSILRLMSLESLRLDHNLLVELPYEIGQLSNLTLLHVHGNPIVELPCSMHLLTRLQDDGWQFDCSHVQSPPPEIAARGLRAIKDFMYDLVKGSSPCYRIKLLLVGQENVGKSSLLRRLQSYRPNKAHSTPSAANDAHTMPNISTDGIDIATVHVPTPYVSKRNDKIVIQFSVWDFAGQGRSHTLTHSLICCLVNMCHVACHVVWSLGISGKQPCQ
jgi:Leucine-rich repeat (LRR) protein